MVRPCPAGEAGQASILTLGLVLAAIGLGALIVVVGQVFLQQARLQRAADIAAAGAAHAASDDPARHAQQLARANGAGAARLDIDASTGDAYVEVRGVAPGLPFGASVQALHARAYLPRAMAMHGQPRGGVVTSVAGRYYSGPLVRVDSTVICPAVAASYRRMQAAAALAGVQLWATSGYRGVEEQAALYARLGPGIAAPPGTSLHHQATELDLQVGPAGSPVHRWLAQNAGSFGFIQRYSWEPWHWGNTRGC